MKDRKIKLKVVQNFHLVLFLVLKFLQKIFFMVCFVCIEVLNLTKLHLFMDIYFLITATMWTASMAEQLTHMPHVQEV